MPICHLQELFKFTSVSSFAIMNEAVPKSPRLFRMKELWQEIHYGQQRISQSVDESKALFSDVGQLPCLTLGVKNRFPSVKTNWIIGRHHEHGSIRLTTNVMRFIQGKLKISSGDDCCKCATDH